jgi:hypothetical protein
MKRFAVLLMLVACTDETSSRRALENQGFTNINFQGYDFAACSEDDAYHTKFIATNPQGKRVDGVVCCGFAFKACTVRW